MHTGSAKKQISLFCLHLKKRVRKYPGDCVSMSVCDKATPMNWEGRDGVMELLGHKQAQSSVTTCSFESVGWKETLGAFSFICLRLQLAKYLNCYSS